MVMVPPKTQFDVGDRVKHTGKNSPGPTAIGRIVQSAGGGYLVDFPGGVGPRVFMPQELQFVMTASAAVDQAHADQAHKDSLTRTMGGLHSELYDAASEACICISVAQKDDYGNVRGGVTGDDSIACAATYLRAALALAEAFEHCKSERERYYGPFVGKGESVIAAQDKDDEP